MLAVLVGPIQSKGENQIHPSGDRPQFYDPGIRINAHLLNTSEMYG